MLMRTEVTKGQTYDRKKEISRIAKGDDEVKKILENLIYFTSPEDYFYFEIINYMGLHGEKLLLLYKACNQSQECLVKALSTMMQKRISQDKINSIKTQEGFDEIIRDFVL